MWIFLCGLLAAMRWLDIPRSRWRHTSHVAHRDLGDETELEMLLRRVRHEQPVPRVETLTDGHLRALLAR